MRHLWDSGRLSVRDLSAWGPVKLGTLELKAAWSIEDQLGHVVLGRGDRGRRCRGTV